MRTSVVGPLVYCDLGRMGVVFGGGTSMGLHPSLGYATPSGLVCLILGLGEVCIPRKRGGMIREHVV